MPAIVVEGGFGQIANQEGTVSEVQHDVDVTGDKLHTYKILSAIATGVVKEQTRRLPCFKLWQRTDGFWYPDRQNLGKALKSVVHFAKVKSVTSQKPDLSLQNKQKRGKKILVKT